MGNSKNLIFWVLLIFVLTSVANVYHEGAKKVNSKELAFSDFMDEVQNKSIKNVVIEGPNITGKMSDGKDFYSYSPYDPSMIEKLRASGVKIEAKPMSDTSGTFWGVIISLLPVALLIGAWFYFMRQANAGNNKAMSFGRSKAKLVENKKKVTFADVAGVDEEKQELEEIIDFLRSPEKFQRLGGKIPRGVLLVGPPGTGKTLLARAVAGEADVPFFQISGSDFVEMFVGVGASRVRDMFTEAKKNSPCLLFIDEIDAVGRHRGAGLGGGNDEREQTLNQLLVEMDGFEDNENVIIIAATNRPDILDPALLRPGRFDRQVVVNNPDVTGREAILKVHTQKVPLAKDVKLSVVARGTPGFSGADLANLVNEAALLAARKNKHKVTSKDFDEAKDKVLMGSEKKSMSANMDEKVRANTAYHEAGHAICSLYVKDSDPIHKATIVPRGRALGMVQRLPEKDEYSYSREKMLSTLVVAMGGRVAEELKFGYDKVTSGASGDITSATNLARSMVTKWGLSDALGPVLYADNSEEVFLGRSVTRNQNVSEKTAQLIDAEIKNLIENAYKEAKKILTDNDKEFTLLAEALIEYETLSGEEIKKVIKGEKIDKSAEVPVSEEMRTQSSVPEL
ncbi:MAG: ATP-dependent zinc metalloprotease FtsH [Alphaproteobacteria bacterium]